MALNEAVSLDPDLFDPAATTGAATPAAGAAPAGGQLLDPGFARTQPPIRYPQFSGMNCSTIRNYGPDEESIISDDLGDRRHNLLPAGRHLITRLVAFFATGDSNVTKN